MPTNNHSDNLFDAQAPQTEEEKLWDLLSLYVDGEADPAQAAIVEQMLSSDPAYRRDFDFLMQTSKTMHMLEEVAPPIALRDAIYAGTVRRPTLTGRLRAAWNRATTPAFGRYATVGGAFAVAAIGALLVLPRLNSTNSHNTLPTQVAANSPSSSQYNITISPPDNELAKLDGSKVGPKPPLPFKTTSPTLVYHQSNIRPNLVSPIGPAHPRPDRNAASIVKGPHLPSNHYLPKNNAPHNDGVQVVALGPGYQYDKKMDNNTAPHPPMTIVSPATDDFGPMVVANNETSAPLTDNVVKPTAGMGNSGGEGPAPQSAPKTTVHVATLPPGASQNIAAAVIRHNMTAKYSGYDRNVAENIQRHEVTIDVIKGTF
jgi:hypothetical protein